MATDFAVFLRRFLTAHLAGLRGYSPNTIASYRDAFKLLICYFRDERSIPPEKLTLELIDAAAITGFLTWLRTSRHNTASTSNQRLAAIDSFFTWMQSQDPARMACCQDILTIPAKKHDRPAVAHLTVQQTRQLLALPDRSTRRGRRDATLLATLYDTAARVQELADSTVRDIRLDHPAMAALTGKGRKARARSHPTARQPAPANHATQAGIEENPPDDLTRTAKRTRSARSAETWCWGCDGARIWAFWHPRARVSAVPGCPRPGPPRPSLGGLFVWVWYGRGGGCGSCDGRGAWVFAGADQFRRPGGRGGRGRRVAGKYRLVTVTGPGGVGKTRLAAVVAQAVVGRFADGVWLVELAGVGDPALVPVAVAAALGVQQRRGGPPVEALGEVLARRQLLVVLDNCERVLAAAADLCAALLPLADDIRVLATSREPLGLGRPAFSGQLN